MNNPLISVIIPCFNHGKYIGEAISSVEECRDVDYEIIVINDGSTDDYTISKLDELGNRSVKVINQNNQGASSARNHGIRKAKGKYILPLDADNIISPALISKSVHILENNPIFSIVYTDKFILKGEDIKHKEVGGLDVRRMLISNYIDTCAVFRKTVWEVLGGYDEEVESLEDYEFWLSAISQGFHFHYINAPLYYYRVLENSLIRQSIKSPGFKDAQQLIYRKHVTLLHREYKRMYNEYHYFRHRPIMATLKYLYRSIKR